MYGRWQFGLPWIEYLDGYRSTDNGTRIKFLEWTYWAILYMFNSKLKGLLFDFLIIALLWVYYISMQFWMLSSEVKVEVSSETKEDL